jgi:branched-subunit amino acid aminotransferase/4-amino-4-deoxychorismate lyase
MRMSTIGDVLAGLKKVMLLEANVARLERNIETLGQDVRRTRDYSEAIDKRVARLEGFLDGAAAASSARRPRLPRK